MGTLSSGKEFDSPNAIVAVRTSEQQYPVAQKSSWVRPSWLGMQFIALGPSNSENRRDSWVDEMGG